MLITHRKLLTALLFTLSGVAVLPAQSQEATGLPGGASALQETYQDWRLSCQAANGAKQCSISQQQVQQNGQRILAIELQPVKAGGASGVAILPYGLKLAKGVVLQVDEKPELQSMQFSTCLPAGCILPLTFDAGTLSIIRAGETLKLKTTSMDEQEMIFTVSLKGLSAGLDRLGKL